MLSKLVGATSFYKTTGAAGPNGLKMIYLELLGIINCHHSC
jgi:hypothetical protein